MKDFFRVAAIVSLVVMVVVSFGFESTAQAKQRTEIVIGLSLPLSGNWSAKGRELKWAYEQATDKVNSDGGIPVKDAGKKLKVKLIVLDNESNTMKSAIQVERLINFEKVDMLLGGMEGLTIMADCMAAEKYGTYYHTGFGFPTFRWKEKKFKWSTNYFVSTTALIEPPFELLKAMDSQQRPKKMALLIEDTFGGKGFLKVLQKKIQSYGFESPLEVFLPVGSSDYSQQISQLRAKGVDSAMIFTSLVDLETLVRQMKQSSLNVSFMYVWKGAWSGKLWKDLGKDAQYIFADGFWSMDYPFKGAKELGEEYYKAFGEYSITVGLPYALAQILFEAIEKAGSVDGAKVRAAVLAGRFNTVMGTVKYGEDGYAGFPAVAAQWWDGKQMLVFPAEYAVSKVKLAPPWDKR